MLSMLRLTTAIALPLALLASCASGSSAPEPPTKTGAERLHELEARLVAADRVHVAFEVTAEGAVEAAFSGALEVHGRNRAACSADGSFQGLAVTPSLDSDGDFYHGGTASQRFEGPAPAALDEGLLIGATRMGLLHNLAMLSSGAPPDHCDGTVREWTQARDVVAGEDPESGAPTLSFDVFVDGEEVARATLYLGPDGLPTRRTQTVAFDGGEMRVEERYAEFTLD